MKANTNSSKKALKQAIEYGNFCNSFSSTGLVDANFHINTRMTYPNKLQYLLFIHFLVLFLLLFLLQGCEQQKMYETAQYSPPYLQSNRVAETKFSLSPLSMSADKTIFGAMGNTLYQITDNDKLIERHRFNAPVVGLHIVDNKTILISTDKGHFDTSNPCTIYLSLDAGNSFKKILTLPHAAALSWSLSSNQQGDIFVAEYGDKDKGVAHRLWRSNDLGESWQVIFETPDEKGNHLHRIAVNPFNNDLWLSVGDGKHQRGIFCSQDNGKNWQYMADSQATGIAFSGNKIFLGEDKADRGQVSVMLNDKHKLKQLLKVNKLGNFSGSIYQLLSVDGSLYVPFMQYGDQLHNASVWQYQDDTWQPLIIHKNNKLGINNSSIAGPDKNGWIYLSTGHKIKHEAIKGDAIQ